MRRTRRALLALVLGATTVLAVPEPSFDPSLKGSTTEADVQVDGVLINCMSPNHDFPDLASATIKGTGRATAGSGLPCEPLLTIDGTLTIDWPGPHGSKASFHVNTNPFNGPVVIEVEVTDGPLTGDRLVPLIEEVKPNLDCPLIGLKSLSTELAQAVFK
jgi:hypothetical protein